MGRKAADGNRRFQRELRAMMFGFGDSSAPLTQSVQLMEDMVTDYLQQLLHKASEACEHRQRLQRRGADSTNAPKVREKDLLFVLRKDHRRLRRVQELLEVYEDQKEAR